MYSKLKRRGNGRFHVFSTWNTRAVFVGRFLEKKKQQQKNLKDYTPIKETFMSLSYETQNEFFFVHLIIQKQPPKVFCEKGILKNFANFTGKHLRWSLFLIKPRSATLLKRNSMFSCKISEILTRKRLGVNLSMYIVRRE